MISVDHALRIVLETAQVLPVRSVPITECSGLVLGENVISSENIPSFDNSAMDGYAVRFIDVQNASRENPVTLKVVDVLPAGKVSQRHLENDETIQIMTGAPLPSGADAVVMVEQTEKKNDNEVLVFSPVQKNENCRKAGDDIKAGLVVFQKGRLIKPYDVGVLASIGKSTLQIIPKPTVAILSTGDELVGMDEILPPGKIRSSNNYALRALIGKMGIAVVDLGIAKDTLKDTEEKLRSAFSADIVLTSGGVSMGEFDYVKQALEKLNVDIKFWKVKQKPGKPLVFGSYQSKLFFGLPGNPVSTIVCFELFVVPAIKKMSNVDHYMPNRVRAISSALIPKKPGLRYFLRGVISKNDREFIVSPMDNQSSGVMSSLSYANCLIDIPEESGNIEAGQVVTAILLDAQTLNDLMSN
ncbi:molybdopterin molybdotransferase MoeA [bacterium]|nr:molybdopterin molybdotransferase MoeA [bacterium]